MSDQRNICVFCKNPLSDNELVKDAYKMNTTTLWAKGQLRIIADMIESRGSINQDFVIRELRRIAEGIRTL